MAEQQKNDTVDKDFLATFARGLEVIKSFDAQTPAMTLTEVAKKNDLSRASARRFLLTLQKLGYVSSDGKQFRLTARVLDLGYSYLSTLNFGGVITRYMEEVTLKLGESCSASVLDGQNIVYIARVPVRGLLPINLQIGAKLPAYATSMGRVLLAAMPQEHLDIFLAEAPFEALTPYTLTEASQLREEVDKVRQQGYAINDQQLELGLRSVAVPVFDRHHNVRFALNVSTHVSKVSKEKLIAEFVPLLEETAKKITASLP
ncbi:IclR family transcriptional regulator domain-containing protein [Gallaecimonas pentaromativorans]|uniref:IclR family transcriptional regulator n=1 Tax=Gallaecimonas pentaromativorans TaxID=584787 RepID=A0A3N1PKJ1_9GAMM|nr:IclR family transcriptional regulator C-terminal domain-containing protein [Gallaecimonas pentaromativorans]MED5525473.1 IclR family transcriptional regulator C-terminal domain-containing protein [Pseudomonadota bacterium]ROQ27477.1 IclR family transcriptional regulator [Gallaecimonas pentaromativorans]